MTSFFSSRDMAPDLLATSVTRAERMASEASSLELREAHLWGQSNGSISYPLEVDLSIISVENKREPFDRQDGPYLGLGSFSTFVPVINVKKLREFSALGREPLRMPCHVTPRKN
jgi:hypothetical protein